MTDQENAAEAQKAQDAQMRRPLPYPMTEEEKRSYDYYEYKREKLKTKLRYKQEDFEEDASL